MVLKFVSLAKTRRGPGERRRSCGKVDVLGREIKSSPGKVRQEGVAFWERLLSAGPTLQGLLLKDLSSRLFMVETGERYAD